MSGKKKENGKRGEGGKGRREGREEKDKEERKDGQTMKKVMCIDSPQRRLAPLSVSGGGYPTCTVQSNRPLRNHYSASSCNNGWCRHNAVDVSPPHAT